MAVGFVNSIGQSQPIPVNMGGTGVSSVVAYTPLCGGTTTTAALQSVASLGTSGQILTSNGASSLPTFQDAPAGSGFTSIKIVTFTSSGTFTYTKDAGTVYCIVEVIGGGGGGGGIAGTPSFTGGGGSGGYSRLRIAASSISGSSNVIVGAAGSAGSSSGGDGGDGGASSFKNSGGTTVCSANGGSGGKGSTTGTGAGGAAGAATAGDFQINGSPGMNGISTVLSGSGANSVWGQGGPLRATGSAAGIAGTGFGSGGGGSGTTSAAGGAGSVGAVIITEYLA